MGKGDPGSGEKELVMVGPVVVYAGSLPTDGSRTFHALPPGMKQLAVCDVRHAYPWHPALPAIASWLAETTNASALLKSLIVVADSVTEVFSPDETKAMRSLYKSLTPEAGDVGART